MISAITRGLRILLDCPLIPMVRTDTTAARTRREVKSAEQVIREALRYDHNNGGNARQIVNGLREAGWLLTPASEVALAETTRVFSADRWRGASAEAPCGP